MPNLKAIRKRISSVRNTQKITRAMKLVAAARLRRAQEAIGALRPYAQALEAIVAELATRNQASEKHPLLAPRTLQRTELIIVTSDRGLAGPYNSNVTRAAERFALEQDVSFAEIKMVVLGRKGREYFRRRKANVVDEFAGVSAPEARARAQKLAEHVLSRYLAEEVDSVHLVFNEFKTAISQRVEIMRLLPIEAKLLPAGATPVDFIYEPDVDAVLNHILPLHVETNIYRVFLDAIASEYGARMAAMDNATNNAKEMIQKLTLDYNRARQAAITKELLEIIGGAEALKG